MLFKIVFSPTGGTDKVADILCGALAETFESIDLSDPNFDGSAAALTADDRAIIALPSFGGRAPSVAIERLKEIRGNGAKCVLVCVYGNRAYEDTLVEMEDAARKAGFDVRAGLAAVAEHSIMHQYATGRPDATDVDHLLIAAAAIAQAFASGAPNADLHIPGNRPYKKAGAAGLVPAVDEKACVKCGKCAESCPVQAIEPETFKAAKDVCISCMRCIAVCPQGARHVNKLMVGIAAKAIKKAAETRKEIELFL